MSKEVHYSDYLQLDKILNAQNMESLKHGVKAHDEMLFIIIHQAYELWFKQIIYEIDSVAEIMNKPSINDNSPDLQVAVHRLGRIVTILKVLVSQIDILETMTSMDFLDFRDFLRPASGFQSWQFKITEAKLGLKFEERFGQQYYISQLRKEQVDMIRKVEGSKTLLEQVNLWLERMPFFKDAKYWKTYVPVAPSNKDMHVFWNDYIHVYNEGLAEGEKQNLEVFKKLFLGENDKTKALSPEASRAALFIMLYRGYPLLDLPFQLLNNLQEIDEQMSTWRFRHVNMVHRMIGSRIGTGGSSGKEYLKGALDKHYIFKDLVTLSSFLIERRRLPKLSKELEGVLGFH
jgi:tryptophan 2,3-dioxygenase